MTHYRSNGNGRVKTADNWTFQTNPYITARPQIHCVGDDCKRSDLNVYYQYGKMNVNPPELIQYIPVILIATLALIILIIFLVKRHRANKKYQESMLSRMDDLREREYIETL
ncbi:putative integral membrane protein [Theileria parva strain Muguga]|uniref:putative integral membrane protein n=1 Tax=Theileria parva strain Muguga TaxID=333668 RepID=UPI001C61A8BF|nr:putative integral membrane protein [Theileria parva strain Muguga]KAF5153149.1 putative integral membrane protein [Theileria parva strain Muguga]